MREREWECEGEGGDTQGVKEGGRKGGGGTHTFPCPNVCLTLATFTFKAKSKLLIETQLEMHCSAIN